MDVIKVVYLVAGPLTSRWLDYYNLDEIDSYSDFNIEYWNCANLLTSGGYKVTNIIHRHYEKQISNYSNFEIELSKLPRNTLFISEIAFLPSTKKYTKILSKYLKYHIDIDIWSSVIKKLSQGDICETPEKIEKDKNAYLDVKEWLFRFDIIKLLWRFLKFGFTKPFYDLLFQVKEKKELLSISKYIKKFKTYKLSYLPDCEFRILHPDYIKYLQIKDNKSIFSEPYILFIAQFYPYHVDHSTTTFLKDIKDVAVEYYKSLNKFFDKIEQKYKCKVIIAEHPSGFHEINPYNDRKIFYYKTGELIKNAFAVCMHYSNTIDFIALYNKPISIITCDAISYNISVKTSIANFAERINMPLIKIDDDIQYDNLFNYLDSGQLETIRNILEYNESYTSNSELFANYFRLINRKNKENYS